MVNILKIDTYVREVSESFNLEVKDGWGNENSLILQGIGMLARRKENDNYKRVLSNLVKQINYENKYAGIASFYEMEAGEEEVLERIKNLNNKLNDNIDSEDDEMALVFYMKYESKIGGKERYQDVFNRFKKAAGAVQRNDAYFMTCAIEGIESVDQAIYEYYDGLKVLFKDALARFLEDEKTNDLDITDKALGAFAILKACRLKVILGEKYEQIGLKLYEDVIESENIAEANKGAVVMMIAEKMLQ